MTGSSETSENPDVISDTADFASGRESDETGLTSADIAMFLLDVCNAEWPGEETNKEVEEPSTFDEAWNHPDPEQRAKWRKGIRKEFHDMIKRKVWRMVRKRDIPPDRRCVKCKWVFKINGMGCTMLVW